MSGTTAQIPPVPSSESLRGWADRPGSKSSVRSGQRPASHPAAREVFVDDDGIVVCVAQALDSHFGSFGHVEFESQLAQSRFDDLGRVDVGTNQRRFVAQLKKIRFFRRAHIFFPYSISSASPV